MQTQSMQREPRSPCPCTQAQAPWTAVWEHHSSWLSLWCSHSPHQALSALATRTCSPFGTLASVGLCLEWPLFPYQTIKTSNLILLWALVPLPSWHLSHFSAGCDLSSFNGPVWLLASHLNPWTTWIREKLWKIKGCGTKYSWTSIPEPHTPPWSQYHH